MEAPEPEPPPSRSTTAPRTSRLRFKDGQKPSAPRYATSRSRSRSPSHKHERSHGKRHRRRHHHRHHSRKKHRTPTPSPPASPDAAFRDSLAEALASEEGASYWESVYGQPLHTFPRPETQAQARASGQDDPMREDENGQPILERMGDDEYAAYVRERMWERSHQYIIEERQRREERAARAREEEKRERRRRRDWRAAWEDLANGGGGGGVTDANSASMGRSEAQLWATRWESYLEAWSALDQRVLSTSQHPSVDSSNDKTHKKRLGIPYPMVKNSRKDLDINPAEIEGFFRNIAKAGSLPTSLLATLKTERVRWHPDKMAQRYGSLLNFSVEERANVTAVFQAVDALYGKVLAAEKGSGEEKK